MSHIIFLTCRQWDSRMKTIATKRLRKFGKALTATSMGRYFNSAILEIQGDGDNPVLAINEPEYKRLRTLYLNNSDDDLRQQRTE